MRILELLEDFILKCFLGILGILFVNQLLADMGIISTIGVNPCTVLTVGILGLPGFLGLYLLCFFRLL